MAAVNTVRLRTLAAWLMARAAAERKGFVLAELSIAVVDNEGITPLNEQFMQHKGATDVISFRLAPPPGQKLAAGEIVINVQRALEESKRRRTDASRELAWYLAHGIDHLAGATDHTPKQRDAMHKVEKRWLREAGSRAIDLILERHPARRSAQRATGASRST